MNLLFHIPPKNLKNTYNNLKSILSGHDNIIFTVMNSIDNRFTLPSHSSNYHSKHTEIENRLGYGRTLGGHETAMKLLYGISEYINTNGGIQGISNDTLLECLAFKTTKEEVELRLTTDGYWAISWTTTLLQPHYQEKVQLEHLDNEFNEIVPKYILEYIGSAINCFKEGMNAVAVALVSIALEATLRDVLAKRGYTYHARGSSTDEFPFTKADFEVDGDSYKITFQDTMPKLPNDFLTSSGGDNKVEIEIKRKIKNENRSDFILKGPQFLLDHLSINTPTRSGVKKVNGLGEALDIARNREGILTPDILPLDVDEVIQAVRNPLIHLSEATLDRRLDCYRNLSETFTLDDFLKSQDMVFDLIINVPNFINEQYKLMYQSSLTVPTTSR
ncbi:hypothetical protein P4H08_25235 [Bacillus cereus]|uniref:hypothetical protein n=1 Tax=Bacillus cereus group TaxID=86661 RepID=UPI000BEB352C|nr:MULTISPECIES: hypothetical protein [Bacillus cereus group]MCC2347489.1 hypothetical protein [Bacillus anthracis]MDA1935450.1 hypothetical protein [Bacillus cereus]MDA1941355.1 hypothetical protein [Bacillus cereus]MEB8676557.1 hypothetical protein [Bacillus cereus]PEB33854.1 hypothetical protein COM77_23340 [Bacillus cereus]